MRVTLDVFSFNKVIHSFSREGRLDEAIGLLSRMDHMGYKPDIFSYNVIINGLCKRRHMERAGKILMRC